METVPTFAVCKTAKGFESDIEKHSKDLPGPGSYPRPSTLTGPKWSFGSSNRSSEVPRQVPGPGAYEVI